MNRVRANSANKSVTLSPVDSSTPRSDPIRLSESTCGLLMRKCSTPSNQPIKFNHQDSGVYLENKSPSPELAQLSITGDKNDIRHQGKQPLLLHSPDNDSGITSDSMDEYEVASSNSSSSRDGCRKYLFKDCDLEQSIPPSNEQCRPVMDPLPPVRERIAHFQEQVRRSIEALSAPGPAFTSFGHNSMSKSASDLRFSSTLTIHKPVIKPAHVPCSQSSEVAATKPLVRSGPPVRNSAFAGHLQPSYRRFTSYEPIVNNTTPLRSSASTTNLLTSELHEPRRQQQQQQQCTAKLKGLLPGSEEQTTGTNLSKSSSSDQLLLTNRVESGDRNCSFTGPSRHILPATSLQSLSGPRSAVPKYTPAFKRRGSDSATTNGSPVVTSSFSYFTSNPMSFLNPLPFSLIRSQPVNSVRPETSSPLTRNWTGSQQLVGSEKESQEEECVKRERMSDDESVTTTMKTENSEEADSCWYRTIASNDFCKTQNDALPFYSNSVSKLESCKQFRALTQRWEERASQEKRQQTSLSTASCRSFKTQLDLSVSPSKGTSDNEKHSAVQTGIRENHDSVGCDDDDHMIRMESWPKEGQSKNGIRERHQLNDGNFVDETIRKNCSTRTSPIIAQQSSCGDNFHTEAKCESIGLPVARPDDLEPQQQQQDPKSNARPNRSAADVKLHQRFSSTDSTASDSGTSTPGPLPEPSVVSTGSRASSFSNLRDSLYGSVTSLASTTSLISPQELQQLIDEANHSLKGETSSHNIQVVVLNRDYKTIGSVGIILAGGVDYEAREVTVSV